MVDRVSQSDLLKLLLSSLYWLCEPSTSPRFQVWILATREKQSFPVVKQACQTVGYQITTWCCALSHSGYGLKPLIGHINSRIRLWQSHLEASCYWLLEKFILNSIFKCVKFNSEMAEVLQESPKYVEAIIVCLPFWYGPNISFMCVIHHVASLTEADKQRSTSGLKWPFHTPKTNSSSDRKIIWNKRKQHKRKLHDIQAQSEACLDHRKVRVNLGDDKVVGFPAGCSGCPYIMIQQVIFWTFTGFILLVKQSWASGLLFSI